MRLSISNIAWESAQDSQIYRLMKQYGYSGLEIAPTKIFPENPYENLAAAEDWKWQMQEQYGLTISSMQSIWYGREEKMFGSDKERAVLRDYTKKAIDFAAAIGCNNLVFGCPRNRVLPEGVDKDIAISFFEELGSYACKKGTVIGLEANPPIYNTNYINDTESALGLIQQVNSKGFLLNLDIGTMIQNEEDIRELAGQVKQINHVHISEPGLKIIKQRRIHQELAELLITESYAKFISVEMGKQEDIGSIENTMKYIREVFVNE